MADQKITELTLLSSTPAYNDVLPLVDVSDTSMSAQGTDKRIQYSNLTNVINVKSYGAVGDGSTDDATAIQSAITAASAGDVVFIPSGIFVIGSRLVIPPFIKLAGTHGNRTDNINTLSILKLKATFSDDAALRLLDKEEGSYSTENEGIRIEALTIDGSATSGTIDGIKASGYIHGVIVNNVCFQKLARRGIYCASYTRLDASSKHPYSWNIWNCLAYQCGAEGFYLGNQQTDCTLLNCETLGCAGNGYVLTATNNTHLIGCRSEFCLNGFYITGSWGTSQGSGGLIMNGCSTDRNTRNGVLIDSTGNAPILINGLMTRRDGRNANAGGGSYAGLQINAATMPIVVNGITCYPGVDDDGTGVNSPDYGVSVTSASYVVLNSGYLHAASAGLNNGGNNTVFRRSMNVLTASGSTSSPTHDSATPWNTNGSGSIALTTVDQAALLISNTLGNTGIPLIDVTGNATTTRIFGGLVSGEGVRRLNMRIDGVFEWGDGTNARDTNLYRTAANQLKSDDTIIAADGITTKTKAGTPSDADFATTPSDGTFVVDTSANKIWVRVSSAWKSAALT